jgi:hypothetical protein
VRAQSDRGERRFDGVGGAQVDPVLGRLCRAPDYAERIEGVTPGEFGWDECAVSQSA